MGLLKRAKFYNDFRDVLEDDVHDISHWYENPPQLSQSSGRMTEKEHMERVDNTLDGLGDYLNKLFPAL